MMWIWTKMTKRKNVSQYLQDILNSIFTYPGIHFSDLTEIHWQLHLVFLSHGKNISH